MASVFSHVTRRSAVVVLLGVTLLSGCAQKRGQIPVGVTQPDKYLWEQGSAALEERRWYTAREYFQQLVDGYPQSPYRSEAKLGVGDAYLGDGTIEGKLRAEREFQEFLAYFPTHPRADYSQYRLAMTHYEQMPKAERDQTATKAALEQFALFRERYPNSALMPEVAAREREARDRLGMSAYKVGLYYHRARWYPGAIARFKEVLEADAQYTHRDAVFYHLAEALVEMRREAEALPYLARLQEEFLESDYLADGGRLAEKVRATLAQRTPDETTPVARQSTNR
jgi:outer membrane protein assembly factor BamD